MFFPGNIGLAQLPAETGLLIVLYPTLEVDQSYVNSSAVLFFYTHRMYTEYKEWCLQHSVFLLGCSMYPYVSIPCSRRNASWSVSNCVARCSWNDPRLSQQPGVLQRPVHCHVRSVSTRHQHDSWHCLTHKAAKATVEALLTLSFHEFEQKIWVIFFRTLTLGIGPSGKSRSPFRPRRLQQRHAVGPAVSRNPTSVWGNQRGGGGHTGESSVGVLCLQKEWNGKRVKTLVLHLSLPWFEGRKVKKNIQNSGHNKRKSCNCQILSNSAKWSNTLIPYILAPDLPDEAAHLDFDIHASALRFEMIRPPRLVWRCGNELSTLLLSFATELGQDLSTVGGRANVQNMPRPMTNELRKPIKSVKVSGKYLEVPKCPKCDLVAFHWWPYRTRSIHLTTEASSVKSWQEVGMWQKCGTFLPVPSGQCTWIKIISKVVFQHHLWTTMGLSSQFVWGLGTMVWYCMTMCKNTLQMFAHVQHLVIAAEERMAEGIGGPCGMTWVHNFHNWWQTSISIQWISAGFTCNNLFDVKLLQPSHWIHIFRIRFRKLFLHVFLQFATGEFAKFRETTRYFMDFFPRKSFQNTRVLSLISTFHEDVIRGFWRLKGQCVPLDLRRSA